MPKCIRGHSNEIAAESKIVSSSSEAYRKVKEGGMKWNGKRVTDPRMEVEFMWPGIGIIQLGKQHFAMVLRKPPA